MTHHAGRLSVPATDRPHSVRAPHRPTARIASGHEYGTNTSTMGTMPTNEQIVNALTRREDILTLISASVRDRGYPPAQRELSAWLNVSGRQVAKDLDRLERDGLITRDAGVARSLRVTDNPR